MEAQNMMRKAFFWMLLVGAVALGAGAAPAWATISAGSVEVFESPGQYTVINNTPDQYIYQLEVKTPATSDDNPMTTQRNWLASFGGPIGCVNSSCFNKYGNWDANSDAVADLDDDIGPGETSNNFTFDAPLASQWIVDTVTADGSVGHFTGQTIVSEPLSLGLFVIGLTGLAWRRRVARSISVAPTTA
jgi:hypothetical protein